MKNRRAIHRADCKRSEWAWWRWGGARSSLPDCRSNVSPTSVVAWIGAEMEFALSQAVASGDAFEHRRSECGHCVQGYYQVK